MGHRLPEEPLKHIGISFHDLMYPLYPEMRVIFVYFNLDLL